MREHNEFISREHFFALGTDEDSGRHYVSIPVTIGVADYNECYALEDSNYQEWIALPSLALPFVEECRKRQHDDLLLQQPGWNRGIPI